MEPAAARAGVDSDEVTALRLQGLPWRAAPRLPHAAGAAEPGGPGRVPPTRAVAGVPRHGGVRPVPASPARWSTARSAA